MSVVLKSLIYFGICYVLVLLIYLLFINRKRKKYEEGKNFVEVNYLINRFKLDMTKTKYKTVILTISFVNSFIIAFTFALIINLKYKYFFKLLIAFALMFILIYAVYEIVGRILKRLENKKK